MNEIEKMYENANVKPVCDGLDCFTCNAKCNNGKYPEFTAEKLINLVMFLINKGDLDIKKGSVDITFESFTNCIAGLINNIWQDLTSEEKQQVKEVLE